MSTSWVIEAKRSPSRYWTGAVGWMVAAVARAPTRHRRAGVPRATDADAAAGSGCTAVIEARMIRPARARCCTRAGNTTDKPPSRRSRMDHVRRRACAHVAVVIALVTTACASHSGPAAVQPDLFDFARVADSIINTPPLHRAHLGIEVYDPTTKRVLYAHNSERRFVPASNQKLWPTTTALHELGPDFRYRTSILAVGFDNTARTAQTLIVVGRGDPTLSARFHGEDHAALTQLADSIAAAGVARITGDLVVDASYFDAAIIPGSWTFGNLNGTSAPPTGAFVVAEGVFRVRLAPGATAGVAAVVEPLAPPGLVPLLNGVVTAPAGSDVGTATSRGPWNDTLRITGGVALGEEPRNLRLPMTDPVRFAAHALADALRARGVTLDGTIRVVHDTIEATTLRADSASDASSPALREITVWTSPPLSDIVAAILGPSQNWIAEQLLRTLGAEKGRTGSWSAGVNVERRFLFDVVGIDSTAVRLNDGSGMSNQNLVTP